MTLHTITLATFLLAISVTTYAKVTPEQAKMLGQSLTIVGAEKAGNKQGTIPSYTGGLVGSQTGNPFAQETPLFIITAQNMQQYDAQLTDGQKALLEKYPSYKMPVYPTHRTANYPDFIEKKGVKNSTTAELVDGGNGLKDFDETLPFVIPQSGIEVIWNHISRYRGGSIERNAAQLVVQRNGNFTPIKVRSRLAAPQYLKDGYDPVSDSNVLFYYTQAIKSPARLTGNVLLVHETIDQVNQPRMAWTYNAGQRRVRRAPQVAYDAPGQASEGLRTSDQLDMYNGAPDRYNWELLGKKEMFIPYNAYGISDANLTYNDIVQENHINPNVTRYERHRVWVVEATLKEGARHIYAKRRFYIDEDSWQIAVADHYDNRGELWRVAEGHGMQFTEANTFWYAASTNYDLFSGRYLAELNNEERDAFVFGLDASHRDFTSAAIRRQGKR